MRHFFVRTPHAEACVAMSETGIRSARCLGDDAALSSVLLVLGWAYSVTGRPADADGCFTEALEIGRRAGDRIAETLALNSIAVSLTHQGRFDEAIDCLREALDILAATGEQRSLHAGLVQNNLGDALRYLNRFGEALPHVEQSLAIHQKIGDPFCTSITEITLAETYLGLGRYEDAIRHCRKALTIQHDTARHSTTRAEALCCLGDALAALGRADEARETWLTALPILDRLGDHQAAEVRGRLSGADQH
jgi:tetratricopeptide (TPR) repeat protein